MKNPKFYLLLILVSTLIISCKSDDEDNSNPEELIIGVWKPMKEVSECPNGDVFTYEHSECSQTGRMTFGESGYFQEIAKSGDGIGIGCGVDYNDEGTWSIENGNLSINYGSGNINEVTYFKVTNNTLKVGQYDDDECNGGWYYTELTRVD